MKHDGLHRNPHLLAVAEVGLQLAHALVPLLMCARRRRPRRRQLLRAAVALLPLAHDKVASWMKPFASSIIHDGTS